MQVDTTGMSSRCNGYFMLRWNLLIGCLPFLSSHILADPSFMSLNLGGVVRVVPNGTKHATITDSEHFDQLYISQWLLQQEAPQMKSKDETLEVSLATGQFGQTLMVSSLLEPVTSSVCGRLAAGLSINGRLLCRSFIFLYRQTVNIDLKSQFLMFGLIHSSSSPSGTDPFITAIKVELHGCPGFFL